MRDFCRSRASGWRGARLAKKRCCARASACTTTCKTRSDTGWTRTRRSIRRTASASRFRALPVTSVPTAAKLLPGGVQPNLKPPTLISYSLRLEHQLTPNTARHDRLRRIARVSRDYRTGFKRANASDLSGVALPRNLSDALHGFRRDCHRPARAGRHVLHAGGLRSRRGAAAIRRWAARGPGSREGDSSYNALEARRESPIQQGAVAARRLHVVEGAGRRRFVERHDGEQCAGIGFESVRHPSRLGAGDVQRDERGCDQRGL